jgi:hypothetical protein
MIEHCKHREAGIKLVSHVTVCIEKVENLLFVIAVAAPDIWIKRLNINSESMNDCYIHAEPHYNER